EAQRVLGVCMAIGGDAQFSISRGFEVLVFGGDVLAERKMAGRLQGLETEIVTIVRKQIELRDSAARARADRELFDRTYPGTRISDIRLKRDIVRLGRLGNGIGIFRFRYRGNDATPLVGVIAQDVQRVMPSAVCRGRDGFLRVDYQRLPFRLMTWSEW